MTWMSALSGRRPAWNAVPDKSITCSTSSGCPARKWFPSPCAAESPTERRRRISTPSTFMSLPGRAAISCPWTRLTTCFPPPVSCTAAAFSPTCWTACYCHRMVPAFTREEWEMRVSESLRLPKRTVVPFAGLALGDLVTVRVLPPGRVMSTRSKTGRVRV